MIKIEISAPTRWAFLDREMLDIAYFAVIEFRAALDLVRLAGTIRVAAIALHTFSRTSTVV